MEPNGLNSRIFVPKVLFAIKISQFYLFFILRLVFFNYNNAIGLYHPCMHSNLQFDFIFLIFTIVHILLELSMCITSFAHRNTAF